MKNKLKGICLALVIGTIAWILGKHFNLIGGSVFAISIGMIVSLKGLNDSYKPGITFTSKKILQYSIILLGFQMNLYNVIEVGAQSLTITLSTISTALIVAFVASKLLKTDKNLSILIGVGTSICGGSAIAATAPVIKAGDEEITSAISTIFLFNIIAIFIFPPLGRMFGLSDTGFGMWAGTAINDTSSVVAAGQVWSEKALELATIVKLTRTLMILPITFILSLYIARKSKSESNYSLKKIFPWFILGFVATSIITTTGFIPEYVTDELVTVGKFLIVTAMAAVGLNTNLKKLLTNGLKPILLGMCCWVSVAFVSLFIQSIMGLW